MKLCGALFCIIGVSWNVSAAAAEIADISDAPQIERALAKWEQQTTKCKSFRCRFTCLGYDPVSMPREQGQNEVPVRASSGVIEYKSANNASFREETAHVFRLNSHTRQVTESEDRCEHWTTDGSALYRVEHELKLVEVMPIPRDAGKLGWFARQIIPVDPDGNTLPLELVMRPFGFPIHAKDLQRRYTIRRIEPESENVGFWLELTPKLAQGRWFAKIDLILNDEGVSSAIQTTGSNGTDREVLMFNHQEFDPAEPPTAETFAPHPEGYKRVENR